MKDEEFSGLVRRMRPNVHAFAARRLTPDQAEEVVSETFEVVWRKRREAPPDASSWPAWVVGIAKNKVLQQAQATARKHHDNRFLADWEGSYLERTPDVVTGQVIDSLMSRLMLVELTSAERNLLLLAHLCNPPLSVDQLAQSLGISRTACTSRINRLRRRIQELQGEADSSPRPARSFRNG